MKDKLKNKGITLIALIITVIILLILSALIVDFVVDGKIIDKSKQTQADLQNKANEHEQLTGIVRKLYIVDPETGKTIEGNIEFVNLRWESGKASVDITVDVEDYYIQWRKSTEEEWITTETVSQFTTATELEHGDIIVARLTDGTAVSSEVEYEVKDTIPPTVSTIISYNTSRTEVVIKNVSGTDNESGIATYEYIIDDEVIETNTTGGDITATTTEGAIVDVKVRVTDNAGNSVTSNMVTVDLSKYPPVIVSGPTLSSKGPTSFTISITATDQDGDDLTYSLYIQGETLPRASKTSTQGNAVTLTASSLSQYKNYTCYVIVSDGLFEVTSDSLTVKTKCNGKTYTCTTSYCSGGTTTDCSNCTGGVRECYVCSGSGKGAKCDVCGGDGKTNCPQGDTTSIESTKTCPECGITAFYYDQTCNICGLQGFYFECYNGCGYSDTSHKHQGNELTCTSCSGGYETCYYCSGTTEISCSDCDNGSKTVNCTHGLYNPHRYCTHYPTTTTKTSHYYCTHGFDLGEHE